MIFSRHLTAFGGLMALCLMPQGALAQGTTPTISREVVQPLPPASAGDLAAALRRIGANPRDAQALLDAGWASLRLDDITAAASFFTRAEMLGEEIGGTVPAQARAGLAATQIYLRRPVEALQLFEEAERLGLPRDAHAADRGLANDLVGNNARAQEFYRLALAAGDDAEITRRLALSQAIAGDQQASDATLLPLLQRQDLAAYRMRAFALAALGKTEEAVAIADAVMPASLASRIAPYLRYMPRLTRAQQAAAAIFGHFPDAASIGKDDPRVAALAQNAVTTPPPAPLDSRLVPTGAPLGEIRPVAVPPPAQTPVQEPAPQLSLAQSSDDSSADTPAMAAQGGELPPVSAEPPSSQLAVAAPEPAAAQPEALLPEPPPSPPSLAEAFADFSLLPQQASAASGAVDVTAIEPRREVARSAEPAPPAPKPAAQPAHPSRIWVQVATGRDRSALAFDWRRFNRQSAQHFADRKAYVVKWGQTNRLVTGPFASRSEASAFVNTLKAAGIDSFTFTSSAGEAVDPLPGT